MYGSGHRACSRHVAHDYAGALGPLEHAHAESPDDMDVALLLGISGYRLGRLDAAETMLAAAATSTDPASVASARIFLGLIAEARGEAARARAYYTLVADSSTALGASGRQLLQATREGWSVAIASRSGYDSNVALQPAAATAGGSGGDADLTTVGAVAGRPMEDLDLVLDDSLLYRKHARMTDYDLVSNTIGATATFAGERDRTTLGYHFEASLLGGARYDVGHIGEIAYSHGFDDLAAALHYTLEARDYTPVIYAGYTGLTHTGIAELVWAAHVALGYVVERASTADPMLAATGNGGRLTLRLRPARGIELRASALASYRIYDAAALGRRDLYVATDGGVYVDLTRAFGIVVGGTLVRNGSNMAATDYAKWTVFAGLFATAGS